MWVYFFIRILSFHSVEVPTNRPGTGRRRMVGGRGMGGRRAIGGKCPSGGVGGGLGPSPSGEGGTAQTKTIGVRRIGRVRKSPPTRRHSQGRLESGCKPG